MRVIGEGRLPVLCGGGGRGAGEGRLVSSSEESAGGGDAALRFLLAAGVLGDVEREIITMSPSLSVSSCFGLGVTTCGLCWGSGVAGGSGLAAGTSTRGFLVNLKGSGSSSVVPPTSEKSCLVGDTNDSRSGAVSSSSVFPPLPRAVRGRPRLLLMVVARARPRAGVSVDSEGLCFLIGDSSSGISLCLPFLMVSDSSSGRFLVVRFFAVPGATLGRLCEVGISGSGGRPSSGGKLASSGSDSVTGG